MTNDPKMTLEQAQEILSKDFSSIFEVSGARAFLAAVHFWRAASNLRK